KGERMKPMIPTFDEACALALCLCNDASMNAMQRSAAASIVNFLERSAGPALTAAAATTEPEAESVIATFEARLDAYIRAFERAREVTDALFAAFEAKASGLEDSE